MDQDTLNQAWIHVEASLPLGWAVVGVMLVEFLPGDLGVAVEPGRWSALAANLKLEHVAGFGDTPPKALIDLADKLRHRAKTPPHR